VSSLDTSSLQALPYSLVFGSGHLTIYGSCPEMCHVYINMREKMKLQNFSRGNLENYQKRRRSETRKSKERIILHVLTFLPTLIYWVAFGYYPKIKEMKIIEIKKAR